MRAEGTLTHDEAGTLTVRWGQPGLLYGEGHAEDGRFEVELADRPPAAAFDRGLALGEILLLPLGTVPRLGTPLARTTGAASGVALVFIDDAIEHSEAWVHDFPAGFSCGSRTDDGGFAPTPCEDLEVHFQ
jgi:hypothetical protein